LGGEVRLALEVEGASGRRGQVREIEFMLRGRFDLGPRLQGEFLTVPGVLDVMGT
jgi:hypothetical protein